MLTLTRKHSTGELKIYDRKPKMDGEGNPVPGEYEPVLHLLKPDAYGKPFTVNDEQYVLKKHGAILKKSEEKSEAK